MPEIDEARLGQLNEIAQFVDGLWKHPEARKLVQQAIKARDPNYSIPEMDAKNEVLAEVASTKAELAQMKKALDDEKAERERQKQIDSFNATWESEKATLRAEGYMDDGIERIVAHAQKFGIPSLAVAAAHWEKLNPPQSVQTPQSGSSWNFFATPDENDDQAQFMKAMMESRGDDMGALDREINMTIGNLRQNRR